MASSLAPTFTWRTLSCHSKVTLSFDHIVQFQYSNTVDLHVGDCSTILQTMPSGVFQCCVTSPPYYGLRNYKVAGQIGLEQTPDEYVAQLVAVFREVRRVLRDDGTLWLNLGDSYANDSKWGGSSSGKHASGLHGNTGIGRSKKTTGAKAKDLLMIPARVALALQADGWTLRSDVIWHKPNPMPEAVKDRPTSAHEHVFLLSKKPHYYFDAEAVAEPTVTNGNGGLARRPISDTRNIRNVWSIQTVAFKGAHFAVMAPELARRCILAGCPVGGKVLDPFGGAGTTGLVAGESGRFATLIELNPEYAEIARQRLGHYVRCSDSFDDCSFQVAF